MLFDQLRATYTRAPHGLDGLGFASRKLTIDPVAKAFDNAALGPTPPICPPRMAGE